MKEIGFNDVVLIPRVISEISSRDCIEININFNEGLFLRSPIIASPMKDVCNGKIAKEMYSLGGLGIIHRFMTIEEQVNEFKIGGICGCAIGINEDFFDRFLRLYNEGCKIFCIDTANGANMRIKSVLDKLANFSINLIIGNVASKECYSWLQGFPNVTAIRVGIAGGAACTTKNATGISRGMISCIQECATVKKDTLLIADGGIQEPSDMCKAIAFGADMVMLGSAIAATKESPARLIESNGKLYKMYHGSASFEIQKGYKNPKYVEGCIRYLEYNKETLKELNDRFCEGFKSSMSYFNALTIEKFRENISFNYTK
jgi:IMP dehydrogenase